jgi:uncharacterized membrane protein
MTGFYSATVLGTPVYLVAWFFLVCSFVGVVVECLFFLACEGVLESTTGLLYLPLRPLYGVGGCAFALLLHPVVAQPSAVFVLGAVVATVVEYLASLLTDTTLGAVSWDYSHKSLNLHGRVCLAYSLCWGGLALVAMYVVDPLLRGLLGRLPVGTGEGVLTAVLALVLASAVLTVAALARARRRVLDLQAGTGDDRGAPGAVAARTSADRLVDRLVPDPVLINSFPRMTLTTELRELTGQRRAWLRLGPRARTDLVTAEQDARTRVRGAA